MACLLVIQIDIQAVWWEIPRKVVFFEIFLHWFKCTNYSLYDIGKYFQKYSWKYHFFAVLGTVIKWPKVTGSAWQKMTYCEIFTISNADCLVMKQIGNRPITEADTDCWYFLDWFSHLSKLYLICNFIYQN
jgi:hypothetical protein